ncbi:BRO family protein [Neisseria weixii]|uniref:BRO family protein n=1 Tax=Neisseria weixii TaxID=1853276 RepID=UPI00359F8B8D
MTKFSCDMTQQLAVFEPQANITFDSFAQSDENTYWYASDLAMMLGYTDMQAISKAINRAHAVCFQLDIPITENFIQSDSPNCQNDIKLTRFACYLTVMNGNISNSRVAAAQAYFAKLAEEINATFRNAEDVNRVYLRGDITDREKTLSHVAHQHGVQEYGLFQNAGYRGLYNMNINKLKNYKGVGDLKGSLLDFMNPVELAANTFRITQTEEKIRNQNIHGQKPLEKAAEEVGRSVRNVMIQTSGTKPEDLKLSDEKINKVRTGIKQTKRALEKHDKQKKKD